MDTVTKVLDAIEKFGISLVLLIVTLGLLVYIGRDLWKERKLVEPGLKKVTEKLDAVSEKLETLQEDRKKQLEALEAEQKKTLNEIRSLSASVESVKEAIRTDQTYRAIALATDLRRGGAVAGASVGRNPGPRGVSLADLVPPVDKPI